MKKIISIVAAVSLFYSLQSCKEKKQEPVEKPTAFINDSLMKMIHIDTVQSSDATNELKLSGEVGFDENRISKVFSNSSGQVVDVKVSFGDKVKRGQLLAVIRSADIAGNYSDLAGAQADAKIAKRQMDNAQSLYESGISSQREYEEAKENYEKANAELHKINSTIAINGSGHTSAGGMYYITSPASGYIVEKKINPGSFIRSDMSDNIFTVSDLKDVWVWANVYETDIAKVQEGLNANITTLAYPDRVFKGKVDKVSDLLDPENKSLRIRVTLPNDSLMLKPQMFANVIIHNETGSPSLTVPASSVINDNGRAFVVLYNNNNDVKVKEVHPIKTVGTITYLQQGDDGLQAGQKVISQNQILIYDALAAK